MTLNGERVERNGWSSIKFDTGRGGEREEEESNLFSLKFHASKIEELKFRRNDLPPLVLPHYASIFTDAKIYTIIPRREKSRGFRWMENCNGPLNVAHVDRIETRREKQNYEASIVDIIDIFVSDRRIGEFTVLWILIDFRISKILKIYNINKVFETLIVYRLIIIEYNQF